MTTTSAHENENEHGRGLSRRTVLGMAAALGGAAAMSAIGAGGATPANAAGSTVPSARARACELRDSSTCMYRLVCRRSCGIA